MSMHLHPIHSTATIIFRENAPTEAARSCFRPVHLPTNVCRAPQTRTATPAAAATPAGSASSTSLACWHCPHALGFCCTHMRRRPMSRLHPSLPQHALALHCCARHCVEGWAGGCAWEMAPEHLAPGQPPAGDVGGARGLDARTHGVGGVAVAEGACQASPHAVPCSFCYRLRQKRTFLQTECRPWRVPARGR